ncbi:ribonuclease HII [Paucibacter soli]|uniref:ribonuclease HII n=1 Tax=Paucibacter soli TaxID=3133433 RepID=UPI0030AEB13D
MRHYELDDGKLELLLEQCRQAGKVLCGVDEAGRGALAGPVVAAAVSLHGPVPAGLTDSKALTSKRRESLFAALQGCAHIGVGIIGPDVIDQVNILQANFMAMQEALRQLHSKMAGQAINFVIVDGNYLTDPFSQDCEAIGATARTLVKGDARVAAISAASVIAKVTRDRIMADMETTYPGYGFAKSAGYGSPAHMARLAEFGPCPAHRRSFAPVATALRTGVAACI